MTMLDDDRLTSLLAGAAATFEAPKSECFDWSMVKVSGIPYA